MSRKILGIILIVAGIAALLIFFFLGNKKTEQPIIFAPKLMLNALWETYKKDYWDANTGRTIDKQRNSVTTSEGQSYTMLRSVWQDDKDTFDKTWGWTKANLKRPNDNLFSWLYGQRPNGQMGIITEQQGQNSATDGDTDIALSLAFAANRWQDPQYLQEAKNIINDIWNIEIITSTGTSIVLADNLEKQSTGPLLINPSYFEPYAYRIFAQIDPQHNWNSVIDSSYEILKQSSVSSLDKPISAGLPPDWITLDRTTQELKAPTATSTSTNYGYDAMRIPFRIALDWQWNQDNRAKDLLARFYFLNQEWQEKKSLTVPYSHDGVQLSQTESPGFYGSNMGYFLIQQPETAKEVYKTKLEALYSPDNQTWRPTLSYYDANWAWFGIALYNYNLNNLYTPAKAQSRTGSATLTTEGLNY